MGGMAAQIPLKDPEANAAALAKVTADKIREAGAGHDGAWVAHPGLVPVVKKVFRDSLGEKPNQLDVLREDVKVTQEDLLRPHQGTTTEQGLRVNINVGVQYLAAWLSGNGCVPLNNLMEDAATAEISRTQVWQWRQHGVILDNGEKVTGNLITRVIEEELKKIKEAMGEEKYAKSKTELAAALFRDMMLSDKLVDFLTLPAYDLLEHD